MHPIFYSRLEERDDELNGNKIAIALTPLPPGIKFSVSSFSQVSGYTLVRWNQGTEEEYFSGENLWRNYDPVATTGGIIDLSTGSVMDKPMFGQDIWGRVDKSIGKYGISVSIASALRDIKNIYYL